MFKVKSDMAKLLLGGKAEGACTGEVWRMGGGEGEGCEGGGEATTACGQMSALGGAQITATMLP